MDLLLHTNLTSESCLTGECEQIVQDDNTTSSNADSRPSTAEGERAVTQLVCSRESPLYSSQMCHYGIPGNGSRDRWLTYTGQKHV